MIFGARSSWIAMITWSPATSRPLGSPRTGIESSSGTISTSGTGCRSEGNICYRAAGAVKLAITEPYPKLGRAMTPLAARGLLDAAEIDLVGRFKDQSIRDEVAGFKRRLDGCLSRDTTCPP